MLKYWRKLAIMSFFQYINYEVILYEIKIKEGICIIFGECFVF